MRPSSRIVPRARRRGAVMAITSWVLVIVVALTLGLAYDTQLAVRTIRNGEERAQAYYAAISGLERFCAMIETSTDPYIAPGQGWDQIDSDQEGILPESGRLRYLLLAEDNCGRVDLNVVTAAELQNLTDLTEDQIAAIEAFRTGAGQAQSTGEQASTAREFRSVDELLLVEGFTPDMLYGAATWQERLSPAERFRQEWALRLSATQTQQGVELAPLLSNRFTVGARVRRVACDGLPRVSLSGISRQELQERLEACSQVLGAAAASQGGADDAAPVSRAMRVLDRRDLNNWSDVWGAVGNNAQAVRLLADVITLPNTGQGTAGGAGGIGGGTDGPGGDIGGPGFGGGPGGGRGGPGGGFGGPGGGPGGGGFGGGGRGGPGGGPGGGRGGPGGGPGGGGFGGPGGGPGGGGRGGPGGGGFGGGGRGGPGGGGFGGGGASLWTQPRWTPAVYSGSPPFLLFVQAPDGGGGSGRSAPGLASGAADPAANEPIEGAVNLNTAPLEVLMTLPQMTQEAAEAIASYRQSNPFVTRGDLATLPGLPRQVFNAVVERVTTISDSFTVRVLGVARDLKDPARLGDISVHLTAAIDRTTGRCRIVRLRQDN